MLFILVPILLHRKKKKQDDKDYYRQSLHLEKIIAFKAITDNWQAETKMLTVPNLRDGSQLQEWAISKGLPAAPAGYETLQYYRLLCNHVERVNSAQEQEG